MARQSEPQIPILVTRPRVEGEAFAAALTTRFGTRLRPVIAPLIAPRYLTPSIPARDYAAVVFTSARTVEAARRLDVRLPSVAWCVGRKTASVAAEAGFQARSADGDAEALAKAIVADPPDGRILYLRGVDTRGSLLEILESFGIHVDVGIVYAQDPCPMTPEALHLLRGADPVLIPLFSPRTAVLFRAELPPDATAKLHIAAMSIAVAQALDDLPRAALTIARRPDTPGMLDAVESLLVGLSPP